MLDFTSCTMRQVIDRSALMHPSLLADALYSAAQMHQRYAYETPRQDVATIAAGMARDARVVADNLRLEGELPEALTASQETIAFGVAAKLMLVPQSCKADIAGRGYSA